MSRNVQYNVAPRYTCGSPSMVSHGRSLDCRGSGKFVGKELEPVHP